MRVSQFFNILMLSAFSAPSICQTTPEPGFNQLVVSEMLVQPGSEYEGEFIELYNKSPDTIQLDGIRIDDLSTSGTLDALKLGPGDYAIACSRSTAAFFKLYGKTVALSPWPALNNAGDRLVVRNRSGKSIFSLTYDDSWYKDSRKKELGHSLEMIDVANSCTGYHNWSASQAPAKATPGRRNSVAAVNPDLTAPELSFALAPDEQTVVLNFSEKIHRQSLSSLALNAEPAFAYDALYDTVGFNRIFLKTSGRLEGDRQYRLEPRGVFDCNGNTLRPAPVFFHLARPAAPHDIVINEILFNAKPGGMEFVEIYNRSGKTINLNGWRMSATKLIEESNVLFDDHYGIKPGGFLVLTRDIDKLKADFPSAANIAETPNLPALKNEGGYILLADSAFRVVDSVYYEEKMQLPLLNDGHGVSLERVGADMPSGDGENWQSAASIAGFATPGRVNSQSASKEITAAKIVVEPKTFSPLGPSGRNSAAIRYTLDRPGYIASVAVLDASGRVIRRLAENETVGREGAFLWDGMDSHGRIVGIGYYIVYVEIFDLDGNLIKFWEKAAVGG